MTEVEARTIIALLVLAVKTETLPPRITDKQTNKQVTTTGTFSPTAFDFRVNNDTRVWGQGTTSQITAYVENTSQKLTIDFEGQGSTAHFTKAKDEHNRIEFSRIECQGQTVVLTGSPGRFEYYA